MYSVSVFCSRMKGAVTANSLTTMTTTMMTGEKTTMTTLWGAMTIGRTMTVNLQPTIASTAFILRQDEGITWYMKTIT